MPREHEGEQATYSASGTPVGSRPCASYGLQILLALLVPLPVLVGGCQSPAIHASDHAFTLPYDPSVVANQLADMEPALNADTDACEPIPARTAGSEPLPDNRNATTKSRPTPDTHRVSALGKITHLDPARKQVAITIDDGPHPGFTPRLLEILRQHDARATFFVVGRLAREHPDLVRAELADGHSVGNHTFSHKDLTTLTRAEMREQIGACDGVLGEIAGRPVHLFRPPYTHYNQGVLQVARELDYVVVLWSVHSGDVGTRSADRIARDVLQSARPGSIILFHDGSPQTLDALPQVLAGLRDRGYTFVTLDEAVSDLLEGRPAG